MGLPRDPPKQIKSPLDNIPVHQFSSVTNFRGPENLLCYQPGELKKESITNIELDQIHVCETCYRKFEDEASLQIHTKIDHEDRDKMKKLNEIHPDFYFFSHRKGIKIPKTQFVSAFDNLIVNPK
jgi:hypothetical protein